MKPLLAAMQQVDRVAMGFTPITENAKIRLEESQGRSYDAMLHVHGKTSRTIAFRRTPAGYRWIAEQETHLGPKWERTVEGTFRESVIIEYQTEPVNGIPTNQLHIRYSGLNSTLMRPHELTLAEVQPMLEAWETAVVEPRPPDLPYEEEDFNPFLFFMLIGFLLACFLACLVALLIGAVVVLVVTGLVAAGIISASVVTGILRRSVSSGFRALFLQAGAVVGLLMGSIGSLVFIMLAKLPIDSAKPWMIGAIVGLIGGALMAWFFNFVWGRSVSWIASKLPRRKPERLEPARDT